MGWIKWVGGGIASLAVAGAILFGIVAAGGGASAQESGEPAAGDEGLFFDTQVVELLGPGGEEYLALVAEKLGVTVEQLQTAMQEARDELGLPDRGDRGPGFRRGAIFGWGLHGAVAAAAEIIGIEPQDLIAGLRDGKSLAQIGEENGVSRDDLKAGIVAAITERVNTAVANERINQERADEVIANLPDRVEQLLDKTHTPRTDDTDDGQGS